MTPVLFSFLSLLLSLVAIGLLIWSLFALSRAQQTQALQANLLKAQVDSQIVQLAQSLQQIQTWLTTQAAQREDSARQSAQADRKELSESLERFQHASTQSFELFSSSLGQRFSDILQKQEALTTQTEARLQAIRESLHSHLLSLQKDNEDKLEKIRTTVEEKLQTTLESRLGESFKLVSERLESVQKGLVEMQTLAAGVGDLKKVLSNVKSKGVLGEYQLEALLNNILIPSQYEKNVATKPNAKERVEFAIRLPNKTNADAPLLLPIDAKFPTQSYEQLLSAVEQAIPEEIEKAQKALAQNIESFAADIHVKYINPPYTTDFAILFLPFEGLFAEVLRIPGLFESIQQKHHITLTGPTTLCAFLNSLQVGFRCLAVEQRSSEIWTILGAVKHEFEKLGGVLTKTLSHLTTAQKDISEITTRSRAMERRLRQVESLPADQASPLIEQIVSQNTAADDPVAPSLF